MPLQILHHRNKYKRVYKTLVRGCLKRPQRNQQNLPAHCVDCEDTRKYVKNSIELYHHFSNPSLNRRWTCDECDSNNSSVTWHCVICDTVSYLAPIYKETLAHRGNKQQQQQQQNAVDKFMLNCTSNVSISDASTAVHMLHKRALKKPKFYKLRRTQSLTTDKAAFSGRSCHICFVVNNSRKDIFNLPTNTFMNRYNRRESNSYNTSQDEDIFGEL